MERSIVALNAGSSSLKFAVYRAGEGGPVERYRGEVAPIGSREARLRVRGDRNERDVQDEAVRADDLEQALQVFGAWFDRQHEKREVVAVGHRIVHGGQKFLQPISLDDAALAELEALIPFAPLHQPAGLLGVREARRRWPRALQVACFDTAFHATQPRLARLFALPRELSEQGIVRYGFHGLSVESVLYQLEDAEPQLVNARWLVAHLGSGCSITAVAGGRSIATTMGFSTLDGLPMSTRCGSLDPGVLLHLLEQGWHKEQLADLLYHRAGLRGVSGLSGDMRELLASTDPAAHEAVQLFVYRTVREVGALVAVLGGLDGFVFTGGIGENAASVRAQIASGLSWLGVHLDEEANERGEGRISSAQSAVVVRVVRSDEAQIIARYTWQRLTAPASRTTNRGAARTP